jgi:hypothetical protein
VYGIYISFLPNVWVCGLKTNIRVVVPMVVCYAKLNRGYCFCQELAQDLLILAGL